MPPSKVSSGTSVAGNVWGTVQLVGGSVAAVALNSPPRE